MSGSYNAGGTPGRVVLVDPTTLGDYNATGSTTNPSVVVGNVAAAATDSGNPVKVGGKYSATLPTLTDGWRGDIQLTSRGALFAAMSGLSQGLANGLSTIVNPFTSTSLGGAAPIGALQYVYNGATIDMMAKPNVSKRIASSAASGNPDFLKASAGNLTKFWGLNGAAITYVQIYNKASAPTIGTDTPILTYPVAANASFDVTIPNGGLYFATGIAYAFTTDAAGTTGAGAAAVTSCNIIGA